MGVPSTCPCAALFGRLMVCKVIVLLCCLPYDVGGVGKAWGVYVAVAGRLSCVGRSFLYWRVYNFCKGE